VALAKRLSLGTHLHSIPALDHHWFTTGKQCDARTSQSRHEVPSSNKSLALCRIDNRTRLSVPARPSSLMAAGYEFQRGSRTRQTFLVYILVHRSACRSHPCGTCRSRLFVASRAATSKRPALPNDHSRLRQRAHHLLALPWVFVDRVIRAAFDLAALRLHHIFNLAKNLNPVHRQKLLHMRMLAFLQFGNRPKVDCLTLVEKHHGIGYFAHEVEIVRHHNRR
jgi:hypothetical protein